MIPSHVPLQMRVWDHQNTRMGLVHEILQGRPTLIQWMGCPQAEIIWPQQTEKLQLMAATPYSPLTAPHMPAMVIFELDVIQILTDELRRKGQKGTVVFDNGCWIVLFDKENEDGSCAELLCDVMSQGKGKVIVCGLNLQPEIPQPTEEENP